MITLIAAFAPNSKETAIFFIAAVVSFALAAFTARMVRLPGGAVGLIALGLALWLWPTMWNTVDAAF